MQVKIYQPAKTSTQSGKKNSLWLLKILSEENHRFLDNIMGWTSCKNTLDQLQLKFQNVDDAVNYAKKQGWNYQIIAPQNSLVLPKSYAQNFL